MEIDTILLLLAGFVVSALYFEWRSRRLMRNIGPRVLSGMQRAFFDETTEEDANGGKVVVLRPNARLRAFLGAVVPVLVAEGVKSLKIKAPGPGGLPITLPEGASLADMAPAFLGMLPKKYQGIAGLLLPMAQSFLGGKAGTGTTTTENPFLKGLVP